MSQPPSSLQDILKLSAAQLRLTCKESEEPVETLSQNFTELADITNQLFNQNGKSGEDALDSFLVQELKNKIERSIIAFQFYDRLSQRIHHVVDHIESINDAIENCNTDLHAELKSKITAFQKAYTMENERKVFDAILSGLPIQKAIELGYQKHLDDDDSSVELF
ncbi:MAG: hypothetical protein V2I33_08815 [Kangiellaceae bacterium]|jgi:hypothetical protein|nr:hypothetical protein [Kangiellaceae bacterium]